MLETISLKIDKQILAEIDKNLKKRRYSTRTEFIREAIRDKLSQDEKEQLLKNVDSMFGYSKRKTTDEDLHRAGELVVKRLEKKYGIS